MEKVFTKTPRTDIPQVFLREIAGAGTGTRVDASASAGAAVTGGGMGRVVYFPWDIDRTFWEVLDPDHGKLLANAVAWASNELAPVTGQGVIDVTCWRQKNSLTVHLVNFTNPMMMKGPIRETIPLGAQQVRVRLPAGQPLRTGAVRLLVADTTPAFQQTGEWLEVTVPSVGEHEVVAVDVV